MRFLDICKLAEAEESKGTAALLACPPEVIEKHKQDRLQQFVRGEHADSFSTNVLLKRSERLIFAMDAVTLAEERKRKGKGGDLGVSFRVSKGSYLRSGLFSANSEAQLTAIGQGAFTLTSKRVVFTGERQSRDFPLTAISAVEPGEDGIAVNRRGKQRTKCYLGTDRLKFVLTLIPDETEVWEQTTVEWRMDGEHLQKIIQALVLNK